MIPSGKLIYHLDDDLEIHNAIRAYCVDHLGHAYKDFLTVQSFLSAIKQQTPDLCIVDLNLTESTGAGFAVIKAIRNKFGGKMPILVISRRSLAKDISLSIEFGASDFMAKPIDFTMLDEKITYLLKGAERNSFPLHKILHPVMATLELEVRPTVIDEVYIHLNSEFFILKNTSIRIHHEVIKKIFGHTNLEFVVHDCRLEESDGTYSLRVIAKKADDQYFDRLQRFLLSVS